MASSLNIQEVLLTNTFDEFRLRTNTVIEELNKFGTGSATVIVGSLETSTGLGEDGHLTVNGDLLVTGNATIEGNLTFGNAETDTISFVADIASNVLPDTPYNFSLGSATKQWQDLYLSGTANINIVSATSATVTNDFTVDTTTFHVDSTTNRVGILTTTPDVTLDIGDATDAMHIPVGTTAERPGVAAAGYFRYNTSLNQFEGYSNNVWGAIGGGGTNTFTTDIFTGDNVTTDFVLSQATEFDTNLMVFIDGVYQTPNAYDISTTLGITTLAFSAPPATGRTIVAYVVAAGVSGNNLNQNSFTGDGATVTFTLSIPPVNKNNTQVFIDGVYQQKDAYSVSGYDLTFTDPPPDQTTIEIMTFTQTEVNVPVDGTIESIHLSGDLVTPGALDVTTDLTVTGTTTLNGNLVIGDANTDTITISSEFSSSLIPSQDITYDLGASGKAWRDLYLAGSTIYIGGGKLEYNDTSNQFELKNASDTIVPVSLNANSTTDLSEGTNLYYTTARVLSDGTSIVPGGSLGGTVGDVTLQYRADGNYSGTPAQGSFFFDALNSRLKVYTGSSFIDAVPVSGGGGGATTNANATFSKYLYTISSETNVVTGASDEVVGYTQLYIGKDFEIVTEGTTDFIAFGATTGTVGETFTVDSDGTSAIADLVLGKEYKIVTAGDTDFTAIGAADNNVDTVFTFNGVTTQSATTGTVIAEGNGTANPVLVYVVDDATSVEVYVNGIKQYEGATNDYVATTGSSVNFTYNLPVDALVDVQVYELLTNDAYYIKTETYSQAEVNTQISNALTIYDDQTASDARYVNIDGDTMTGNLDVTGTVTADGANIDGAVTTGDLTIDNDDTPTLNFKKAASADILGTINVSTDAGSGGKMVFQTKRNGDTALDRMTIDDDGNVGIGTDSPSRLLTLSGTGATLLSLVSTDDDNCQLLFGDSASDTVGKILYRHSDDSMAFETNASEAMRIDSAGNVSIGTDSPSTTLTVAGTGDAETGVTATHSRSGVGYTLLLNNTNNGANKGSGIKWQGGGFDTAAIIGRSDATAASADAPGYLTFHTSTDGSEDLAERLRIDSAGRVGIGVSSSVGAPLHMRTGGATNLWLDSSATSDQTNRLVSLHSSGGAYSTLAIDAGTHLFRTGTTEVMRIDSSGQLGVGASSPTSSAHVFETGGDFVSDVLTIESYRPDVGQFSGSSIVFRNSDTNSAGQARIKVGSSNSTDIGLNNESTQSFIFEVGVANTTPTSNISVDGNNIITVVHTAFPNGDILVNDKVSIASGGFQGSWTVESVSSSTQFTASSTTGFDYTSVPTDTSGAVASSTSPFNAMIVRGDGNVGINKINPETLLQIGNGIDRLHGDEHQIVHSSFDLFTNWQSDTAGKGAMLTFSDYYFDGGGPQRTTRAGIKGVTRYAGNDASGALTFYTNESASDSLFPRMTIDETGKVGIRSNTSGYGATWLHVDGDATDNTIGTTEVLRVARPITNAVSFDQYAAFKIGRHSTAGGSFQSFTRLDIDLRDDTSTPNSDTNVMTLLNNGRVGIGNNSPDSRLVVQSPDNTLATDVFKITSQNAAAGLKFGFQRIEQIGPTNPITFNTGGSEAMQIDSSGRVGIGSSPTAQLEIYGVGGSGWSGGARNTLYLKNANSTSNQSNFILFGSEGTGSSCFIGNDITADGTTINQLNVEAGGSGGVFLASGATSWTAVSDERLKTDLETIQNAAAKVSSLRAVTGRYKTDDIDKRRAFLIAQDVQQVLPEAITVGSDEDQTLGLSYADTVPLLVAAIQEQQEQIEQLKAEVAALKGSN